jgi:hypothetical protein
MVAALVVSAAAVVVRFARSSGEERLQLKWVVTAVVLVVAVIIPLALTPQVAPNPAVASPAVATLKVLFCLAVLFFYAAIAIAVLKYRLYEIDIVISKAVQYGRLRRAGRGRRLARG